MPIYEFYCPDCHRLLSFLSRSIETSRTPACPRCGRAGLSRRPSSFAISKGRKEPAPAADDPEGADDPRLERAMEAMAGDLEGLDENDPRQGAQLMRKVFEAAGMPVGGPMQEALRRMEAGEDPEKIEDEMGDALGEDPFGGLLGGEGSEGGQPGVKEPKKAMAGLRRRLLPPTVDPELHEM
jgi:putative FmdB family regulatory protein